MREGEMGDGIGLTSVLQLPVWIVVSSCIVVSSSLPFVRGDEGLLVSLSLLEGLTGSLVNGGGELEGSVSGSPLV